jgi:hypothetical protein
MCGVQRPDPPPPLAVLARQQAPHTMVSSRIVKEFELPNSSRVIREARAAGSQFTPAVRVGGGRNRTSAGAGAGAALPASPTTRRRRQRRSFHQRPRPRGCTYHIVRCMIILQPCAATFDGSSGRRGRALDAQQEQRRTTAAPVPNQHSSNWRDMTALRESGYAPTT